MSSQHLQRSDRWHRLSPRGAAQRITARYAAQHDEARCGAARRGMVRCRAVQRSASRCGVCHPHHAARVAAVRFHIGSISASPTACQLCGYGHAGTQNDRLSEAVILSTGTPIPAQWARRRRCRDALIEMPIMPRVLRVCKLHRMNRLKYSACFGDILIMAAY